MLRSFRDFPFDSKLIGRDPFRAADNTVPLADEQAWSHPVSHGNEVVNRHVGHDKAPPIDDRNTKTCSETVRQSYGSRWFYGRQFERVAPFLGTVLRLRRNEHRTANNRTPNKE